MNWPKDSTVRRHVAAGILATLAVLPSFWEPDVVAEHLGWWGAPLLLPVLPGLIAVYAVTMPVVGHSVELWQYRLATGFTWLGLYVSVRWFLLYRARRSGGS